MRSGCNVFGRDKLSNLWDLAIRLIVSATIWRRPFSTWINRAVAARRDESIWGQTRRCRNSMRRSMSTVAANSVAFRSILEIGLLLGWESKTQVARYRRLDATKIEE